MRQTETNYQYKHNNVIQKDCSTLVIQRNNTSINHVRLSVSLILGAEPDGVEGMTSSSMADMGGLVASGEGTAAGCPKTFEVARLNPILGKAAGGCGLETDGVVGAVPLLNSAQRGHLRFVSGKE